MCCVLRSCILHIVIRASTDVSLTIRTWARALRMRGSDG